MAWPNSPTIDSFSSYSINNYPKQDSDHATESLNYLHMTGKEAEGARSRTSLTPEGWVLYQPLLYIFQADSDQPSYSAHN